MAAAWNEKLSIKQNYKKLGLVGTLKTTRTAEFTEHKNIQVEALDIKVADAVLSAPCIISYETRMILIPCFPKGPAGSP